VALILALSTSAWLTNALNILCVALGLGLVIFIHELGHFAVAKWCNVRVERFSIGFGPILWKATWGETDYALSVIPFGGYVKMLGQDDADPSQMTDASIAKNPRSYPAKTVPQRIAIISAGVLMNLLSAILFFVVAFMAGVQYEPAVIGSVVPGMPAWQAGLRMGDRLTRVGDRDYKELAFIDLRQAVALSQGGVEIEGERDGKHFQVTVHPVKTDEQPFPAIGIEQPERSLTLQEVEGKPMVVEGLSASRATPAFRGGDQIRRIDDTELRSYSDFQRTLSAKRDKTVVFHVRRKGTTDDSPPEQITVGPNHFRTLGLRMEIGEITSIQHGSPAWADRDVLRDDELARVLRVGDKITHVIVNGHERPVGGDLDPLRLPDYFSELAGQEVVIRVKRLREGQDSAIIDVPLVPESRPGWLERPFEADCPLSVPSIGVAFHVLHTVIKVDPSGPAAGRISENDNVQELEFLLPNGRPPDRFKPYEFGAKNRNWATVFWQMQSIDPTWTVRLTVIPFDTKNSKPKVVDLAPVQDGSWYLPTRGLITEPLTLVKRAAGVGDAVQLGFRHTWNSIIEVRLTIQSLISGRISMKALGGPITIAQVAFIFSERGVPDLILFLAILSVNLAVLNFLPVPVLDGGHFVFLCWEGIRGKPPSERVVIAANYVGLMMVLSLMVWVIWLDISRLF